MNTRILKTVLFISIVLLNINIVHAQIDWTSSKRVYDWAAIGGAGIIILDGSDKDSTINNQTYKIINRTEYVSNITGTVFDTLDVEPLLVREESEKVYFYDNEEKLIFDFSREVGDTLEYMDFVNDEIAILKFLGDTIINNQLLKYQDIEIITDWYPGEEIIISVIDNIGPINSFFLTSYFSVGPADGPFYHLKCYEDELISFSSQNVFGLQCDELPIISSNSYFSTIQINVYPNPFKKSFNVDIGSYDIEIIKLFSINGIELKSIKVSENSQTQIQINNTNDGEFILIGMDKENKIRFTKRLTKKGG